MKKGVFIGVIIEHLISEENNIHFKNKTNILNIKDKNRNNEKINKDSSKNKNLDNNNKNKQIDSDNERNDLFIKMLETGETKNGKSKIMNQSDMSHIAQIYNNPSFMKVIKLMNSDSKVSEYINKTPEFKTLKKENPIFKEVIEKPELMDTLLKPEVFNAFSQISSIINKNKGNNEITNEQNNLNKLINNINENFENGQNNKDDLTNPRLVQNNKIKSEKLNLDKKINTNKNKKNIKKDENYYNPNKYDKKFIQLKNMGFTNEEAIKNALVIFHGNMEEAIEQLSLLDAKDKIP